MKKISVLFLIMFTLIISTQAGGGRGYSRLLDIDEFEQSFNYYYKSVKDTISYLNEKGKEKSVIATLNVVMYSIDKDSSFYLFDNTFNEKIVSFFYESEYVANTKSIKFVDCAHRYTYELGFIRNNRNIEERSICEKLFIVSYSYKTKMYTLWTCHKTGRDLKQFCVFNSFGVLKVDVFNQNILTVTETPNGITINKKAY